MFERIKKLFRKGGVSTERLNKPVDHPKIGIDRDEYARIIKNMQIYRGEFPLVKYHDINGHECARPLNSINITKMAAEEMAGLVFNENCHINIAEKNKEAQDRIHEIFEKSGFYQNFIEHLESCFATGGLALRPYYSASENEIKISFVTADKFFPLHSNTNNISEAAFTTQDQVVEGNKTYHYTLFEFHEWNNGSYVISNELYKSDNKLIVGKKVALSSLEKYASLQEKSTISGYFSRPLFVYLKPATMNNINVDSPLGLGMCDNARHEIEYINLANDKFVENVQRAFNGILIDPLYANTRMENGDIHITHDDNKIFLKIPSSLNGEPIKEVTIDVNPDSYIKTINHFFSMFEGQTGFSSGTFTMTEGGVKTAHEVVSEDSKTFRTRNKHANAVEDAIKGLVTSILELSKAHQLYSGATPVECSVDFDDGIFQNKENQLAYYSMAVSAGLMPKAIATQRAFKIPREQADEWQELIAAEERNGLDTTMIFGNE